MHQHPQQAKKSAIAPTKPVTINAAHTLTINSPLVPQFEKRGSADPLSQKQASLMAEAYALAGQWQAATDCFAQLIAGCNAHPTQTLLNRAIEIAEKVGRLEQAFAWQKQLAFSKPFDATVWLKLAQFSEDTNQLELAKTYYQRAIKRDNETLEAWFGLGVISEKQDSFDTAKLYYEALLAINPAWLPALNNWAGCCMQLGYYDEAQQGFSKVLNLMPQYPKAILGMGITLDFSAQHRAACVYYGQYLRLKPASSHSAFVRERLNELEAERFKVMSKRSSSFV
jgi:tetratricopeptide (TPR) repeat protein